MSATATGPRERIDMPTAVAAPDPSDYRRLLPGRPAAAWSDHLARLGPLPARRPADLVTALDAAGLRGRGGAGFPAARKLAAVADAVAASRLPAVVVANCCEGDPTSAKDAVLIDRSPHLVIDGALVAAAAVGADRVLLAGHEGSSVLRTLSRALPQRPAPAVPVEPVVIPARYLASEASSLVRFLNTGDARPAGRLAPIWRSGVDGRPTLVANAETLAQLALLARFGPEWFTAIGSPAEPGTVLVTIGGAVPRPGVIEVPTGTPVRDVLACAGAAPAGWALVGGLAGGWLDLGRSSGVGFDSDELRAAGAARGVGSITVLPPRACVLAETARIVAHQAQAGARQCGPCMFGLPAIADDLAGLVAGDRSAMGRLRRRLPAVDGRGACGHPDGTVGLVTKALAAVATEPGHLEQHLAGRPCRASTAVPLTAAAAVPVERRS
ncbi:SLBB domain-containing protein [Nakamurella sp.]|uniref:SLBB domain-containing protein n=1 Tax=Nakamurella sp. TaxID=1869182 RepID=UPI003B3AA0DD